MKFVNIIMTLEKTTKEIIPTIVEKIVNINSPKIILFGSYTLVTPTEDSDIDLLNQLIQTSFCPSRFLKSFIKPESAET